MHPPNSHETFISGLLTRFRYCWRHRHPEDREEHCEGSPWAALLPNFRCLHALSASSTTRTAFSGSRSFQTSTVTTSSCSFATQSMTVNMSVRRVSMLDASCECAGATQSGRESGQTLILSAGPARRCTSYSTTLPRQIRTMGACALDGSSDCSAVHLD